MNRRAFLKTAATLIGGSALPKLDAQSLHIINLNVWDLPISADRRIRMEHLARTLATSPADVVCLQECWVPQGRSIILNHTKSTFPYAHHYNGSGLLTLSRHPLSDIGFMPYTLNSGPDWADYYANKGIGWATVAHPSGDVKIFNTHMLAGNGPNGRYTAHRTAQQIEAAIAINAHHADLPIVVCGDFNHLPTDPIYTIVPTACRLSDSFATLHPDAIGGTISPQNYYRDTNSTPRRIDFIFNSLHLEPQHSAVTLTTIPNNNLSYSDHYGVETTFAFNPQTPPTITEQQKQAIRTTIQQNLQAGLDRIQPERRTHGAQALAHSTGSAWSGFNPYLPTTARRYGALAFGSVAAYHSYVAGVRLLKEERTLRHLLSTFEEKLYQQ